MASSSTNLGLEVAPPTIDDLLPEHNMRVKTVDMCEDEFDLVTKTITLYRFAIKHHAEPGGELLLRAIAEFEAAEAERQDPVNFSN